MASQQHGAYVGQFYKSALSSPVSEVITHLACILKQHHFKQEGQAEEGVNGFAAALQRYGRSCLVCLTIWHRRSANTETKHKWFSQDFLSLPADRNISGRAGPLYEIPRSSGSSVNMASRHVEYAADGIRVIASLKRLQRCVVSSKRCCPLRNRK